MELQKHIAHPHPLLFNKDGKDGSLCGGCGAGISGPCYRCQVCRFYLHKKCAEAPMAIDVHPLHSHQYPLIHFSSRKRCSLCLQSSKEFMYHCSPCNFFLHIDCALLLRDAARNFIKTKFPFAHQHPLILLPIANDNMHLSNSWCNGCSAPLLDADAFACLDCHTFFHKTCVEMPIEINHPHHRKHQLILEFDSDRRDCNLCERKHGGLFYRCSVCNVCIHSKCAFPPPVIEDKSHHEHPFTPFFRPDPFTCDACGNQGKHVSYICSTCSIQVHKNCISLPLIIAINLHHHPLYRNFFLCLHQHDFKNWECQICFQKMNMEHASYYCSKPDCNFVVHVNCAMDDWNRNWYGEIEFENQDEAEEHFEKSEWEYNKYGDCIINKINVGEDGIAAEIEHSSHGHTLMFRKEIKDKKYCNGCVLPILSSFYYCSNCDFFLHKNCAELTRRLRWFGYQSLTLHINGIFICFFCAHTCSGFSYKFDDAEDYDICLRCARLSHSFTYQAHKPHHIFFDTNFEGHCSACGHEVRVGYRSKDGDFALDVRCPTLPQTVWQKCDEHSLTLTYQDDHDYLLQHYCDICEKKRNPKYWFYHCKDCNTVAHPKCVFEKYPFIKIGTNYTCKEHSHPLTFVRKNYYYPQCDVCDKPCEELSLECAEHECNYIAHAKCIEDLRIPRWREMGERERERE